MQTSVSVSQQPPKPLDKPKRVQGKLVLALKAIVWEGQELDAAATTAGLTTHAVRIALDRPHVKAFLKAEREVFRAYVSAQNIHYARRVRNSSKNDMAVLGAIKVIDNIDETTAGRSGPAQTPGFLISIYNMPAPAPELPRMSTIDGKATELPDQGSAER